MAGWHRGSGGAGQHHHRGTPGGPIINFGGGFTGSTCLADPTAAGAVFCRNSVPQQTSFGAPLFGLPYYWPYTMDYEQPAAEAPAAASEPDNALAAQVAMLTDAVRQLREDQALRETARPPAVSPPTAAEEKVVPLVLVYRDGHRREVDNYAVLGQTLWVFRNQATRRIPLADLDLDATRKVNDERGIDFLASESQ